MTRGDEYVMVPAPLSDTEELRRMRVKLRAGAGKGSSRGKAGREPVTSVAKVEADRGRKNSRVKGNRAELDVADMFSRWCGEVVRRTPGSGGWSNAKFGVTADLVCANKTFPYHCEVKHREHWVLDDLVTGVRKEHDKSIVQWWKQCVDSCPKTGKVGDDDRELAKEPLLVFRRNRQPWLVMISESATVQGGVGVGLFEVPCSPLIRFVKVMLLEVFLDLEPVPKGLKNYKRST
jgi:hypothetical protein